MKSYEEMSRDVLHCIRTYETERTLKRARTTKITASVTLVAAVAIGGAGLWNSGIFSPDDAQLLESTAGSVADEDAVIENSQPAQSTDVTTSTADTHQIVEPFAQQTTTVTQSTAVSSTTPVQGSDITDTGSNLWIMLCTSLEWNGVTYRYNDMADIAAYTQDEYIGKVGDFKGEYEDTPHYWIHSDDSVYTVKETADVLFVVKANGKIVVLSSPAWSLEQYEPERLAPDYTAPHTSGDAADAAVRNDFCHVICKVNHDGAILYTDPSVPEETLRRILADYAE